MFDVFGHTQERRLERSLIDAYEARIREILPLLDPDRLALAVELATLSLSIRGYGHVKLANHALARVREAELLHRFDRARYPAPAHAAVAGQFRGIAVTSAGQSAR